MTGLGRRRAAGIEIAEVLRRFASAYQSAQGTSRLPSQQRAITAILQCRAEVFSYHSCKNRSCPKGHTDQTERWLEARKVERRPTPYVHVTITVPEELRAVLRANQRDGYALLMKAAAEAIIELARDRRFVGATVGVLAVLHTWTQQLLYPHVHCLHCLVTGGGVPADGRQARARQAQRHVQLARYVFRVALTNSRMVGLDDHGVTLRYKKRTSNRWRTCRSTGEELLRRVLRHVLPKGLHKVRDFGLWPPAKHALAARARLLLLLDRPATPRQAETTQGAAALPADHTGPAKPPICLYCNDGRLVRVGRLRPKQAIGP